MTTKEWIAQAKIVADDPSQPGAGRIIRLLAGVAEAAEEVRKHTAMLTGSMWCVPTEFVQELHAALAKLTEAGDA